MAYQKTMRVVIRLGFDIIHLALCHQPPQRRTTGPHQLLRGKTGKGIRVLIRIEPDTVHRNFLRDVSRDQVVEVTRFLQVIILPLSRFIGQVKRLRHIRLDRLLIRAQTKKELVEGLDMVAQFHRQIDLPVRSQSLKHLPVVKDVYPALCAIYRLVTLPDTKATGHHVSQDQQIAEQPDMLKSRIDIFELLKHIAPSKSPPPGGGGTCFFMINIIVN
jgi:hypothetical protein